MRDGPPKSSPLPLPVPAQVSLRIARDRTAQSGAGGGFVNVRRLDLVARYPDATESEPFAYDIATRAAIDAVIVLAYERPSGLPAQVYLRSAPRVPLLLREGFGVAGGNLWELPAGLIEPGEEPRAAAARELEEELGFGVAARELDELGPWMWPVPGFIAERHFYFCVDVTSRPRGTPTEDGSPLERGASIARFPLDALLAQCRAGHIRDQKTELALRRFAERA